MHELIYLLRFFKRKYENTAFIFEIRISGAEQVAFHFV